MLAEIVVHSGIEHITTQPMPSAFPHLSNEQDFRIHRLHSRTEHPPEAIINLTCYVQPPAINVEFTHPIGANLSEVVPYFRVGRIQFRHHPLVSEASVGRVRPWVIWADHWEIQMIKPILVFGQFLIAYHIIKSEEVPATVVEHTVNDNADASLM